jgi:hypothetical protein
VNRLPEEHRAYVAYRAALVVTLLSAFGFLTHLLIGREVRDGNSMPAIAASLASAALALVLMSVRRRIDVTLASIAFLVNTAIVTTGLWFVDEQYGLRAERWVAFQSTKLAMLTVAVLAPELWAGLTSIFTFAAAAFVHWYLFSSDVRTYSAVGEPWAVPAYAAFAAALLIQVRHRFRVERELARAQQESVALARLARTLLAVRDYSNTPLQTLVLELEVMHAKHPELAHDLGIASRAVERMRELGRLLSGIDAGVRSDQVDASFDPLQVLEDIARRAPPSPSSRG